jgi:hypothetical protein
MIPAARRIAGPMVGGTGRISDLESDLYRVRGGRVGECLIGKYLALGVELGEDWEKFSHSSPTGSPTLKCNRLNENPILPSMLVSPPFDSA